jgi:hypothetical protein
MTSFIDATKPVYGGPTTASVRANFQTAHDEISALQAAVAPPSFDVGALVLGGGAGASPIASSLWTEAAGVLTANYSAAGGFLGTQGIYLAGLSGGNQGVQIDGYASVNIVGRRANGTPAAPSPPTANQTLLSVTGGGHDGAAWSNQGGAAISIISGAPWAVGDHSGEVQFSVTPIGSTVRGNACKIAQDSGLMWSGVTGGSKGVGSINLQAGYYIQGVNILTGKSRGQTTPQNPAGTTSATAVMMGLAGSIQPQFNTAVLVAFCGSAANSVAAAGGTVQICWGTGTAPANGAALTGTAIGSVQAFTSPSAAGKVPFCLTAVLTGLTAGTAYWIDLAVAAVGGGTATVSSVATSRHEI